MTCRSFIPSLPMATKTASKLSTGSSFSPSSSRSDASSALTSSQFPVNASKGWTSSAVCAESLRSILLHLPFETDFWNNRAFPDLPGFGCRGSQIVLPDNPWRNGQEIPLPASSFGYYGNERADFRILDVRVREIIGTFRIQLLPQQLPRFYGQGADHGNHLSSSTSSLKTLRVVCGFSLESRSTNSNSGRPPLVLTVFSVFSEAGFG